MNLPTLKKLPEAQLIDRAVELNLAPDNYFTQWELLQDWQIQCLIRNGLKPDHLLLDVGCGAMRLGSAAVQYLNDDCYFGIDPYQPYLDLARIIVQELGIQKRFALLYDKNFNFSGFGKAFDYAMAQSVITHLSLPQVRECFASLKKVMKPGGKFIFTYIIGYPPTLGFCYGGTHPMIRGWIASESVLEKMAQEVGARFSTLPEKHPTGQRVGLIAF